jgi:peptidoglycan/LPS O-acetylase OafA/YrhL
VGSRNSVRQQQSAVRGPCGTPPASCDAHAYRPTGFSVEFLSLLELEQALSRMKKCKRMDPSPRNIPSLDGLRAISVLMVISAHMNAPLARLIPFVPFWLYLDWGALGVQTFFVISGFLITHLLLKELEATGTISLKRFYFRRALRIFPPFYVYLAVALVLTLAGVFSGELRAFLVAGTYTWNYLGSGSELLEHTWSLSLEEQFYLLWPAALVCLGPRKGAKLAVWVILLSPGSRIVTYFLAPHHRALLNAMLHTGLDSIMFGCLLAILWRNTRFNRFLQPFVRGPVAAAAAAFVLFLGPIFPEFRFQGRYSLVFGLTLNAICLSLILIYVVRVPNSPAGRLLNTPVLRHLGIISYSLYLWQQMFTGVNANRFFPWSLAAILGCAELSYWIVERPSLNLRDRMEASFRWKKGTTAVAADPSSSQESQVQEA